MDDLVQAGSSADRFEREKYLYCEQLLDRATCDLATQYALFDRIRGFATELEGELVPGVHSKYADPLMESLLVLKHADIEGLCGLSLIPTYSSIECIRPGAVLKRHKDREACEISVSICIGYSYKDTKSSYRWPLCVGPGNGEVGMAGTPFYCEPGGGVLYRGCEVEHWRDELVCGPDSFHVQAFLHYIDAKGPFAKDFAFDRRPALGLPQTARMPKKVAR